jgi:uncharacterized damage-inducible protein DinB
LAAISSSREELIVISATTEPVRTTSTPSAALSHLLDELSSAVIALPNEVYRATVEGGVSGTIGEHVRHCLDHVSALLAARAGETLSYDHRQRGTAIEVEPSAALQQILRLKAGLERWSVTSLDEPIRVRSVISQNGESVTGWSTFARELAFVVSHTIHHQAIIGLLLATHGYVVADRFGHSPSTPRRN